MPLSTLLLAVAALVSLQAGSAPPTSTPAPSGSHGVGRHAITWVDSTRRDPADSTRPRVIPGWVWYPAATQAGTAGTASPLDSAWNELHAAALAWKIGVAAAARMRTMRVHAVADARWSDAVSRAPVLLFEPGNGWLPSDYSAIIEDLASHGYVVVGITPTGFADVTRFPDGRAIAKVLGKGAAIGTDQVEAHRDMRFVLHELAQMNAAAGAPYRGHLDLARVGTFGHSLGGSSALVVAAGDTMVRAALNLDGDPMGDVVNARPEQPVMLVSSEVPDVAEAPPPPDSMWLVRIRAGLERSELRRSAEWARISSKSAWSRRIRLMGLRHLDFTDAALAQELVTDQRMRWSKWGPIDGARALRLAADVTRAFFDQALLGKPAGAALCDGQCAAPEERVVPVSRASEERK